MHRLAIQLKLALENSGYSRTETCELCDIAPATLSKYLNGKMMPRKDAFARLLKVIPEEFIGTVCTAYLMDLLPAKAEPYVTITGKPEPHTVQENPAEYHTPKLPHELEQAFSELRTFTVKSPVAADFILAMRNSDAMSPGFRNPLSAQNSSRATMSSGLWFESR